MTTPRMGAAITCIREFSGKDILVSDAEAESKGASVMDGKGNEWRLESNLRGDPRPAPCRHPKAMGGERCPQCGKFVP